MADINELTAEIVKALSDETEEYRKKTTKIINRIAKEAVSRVQSASPRKTGAYAKGWKIKRVKSDPQRVEILIHQSKRYQLTHLLENGHAKRGGTGRVEGIPHIRPTESWVDKELERELENL